MIGPSEPSPSPRLESWRQVAVLGAVTLAVFSPALGYGFVYDARLQILTDPFLHDPRNWWPVLTFGTLRMDILDFNRPVNLASLMLDAAVWGKEPFGYHLTSVLVHVGNVLMLWALLRRLAPGMSAVTAVAAPLLFAVHPVVAEAVCEPTFREDLLATCFTLAGLLAASGHNPANRGLDVWRVAACAVCSLMAVGSKESGVAAAAAIGACWLLHRRDEQSWFWPAATAGAWLVAVAFLSARFLLQVSPSAIFESPPQYPGGSLAAAMLIEPRILALYAQLLIVPMNLCADYGLVSVAHLPLPVSLVVIAGIVAATAWAVRADPRIAIAAALVVASLLPVANVVPIYRAAADRYLYLPAAGIALATGLALDSVWRSGGPRLRERAVVVISALLVLFGVGCMERQTVWANPLALWGDTCRKNPSSYTGAFGLAGALRDDGRLVDAEQAARRAITLCEGTRGDAWATLALVLDDRGRVEESFAMLDRAIEADPRLADPDARVTALAMERSVAEALKRLFARRKASQ